VEISRSAASRLLLSFGVVASRHVGFFARRFVIVGLPAFFVLDAWLRTSAPANHVINDSD
jgi:hypothetical protein